MSIEKRMIAKIAGGAVAALAAAAISAAPSALADWPWPPPPPPPPPPDTVTQAAPAPAPGPVPHLYNPNNLPPGTSANPVDGEESAGVSYARQVLEAIQDNDISMGQGLLLLAQRPMDPNATPPPGLAAGPQQPGPNPPPA